MSDAPTSNDRPGGYLERYASDTPGAAALSDGERVVTWAEWNDSREPAGGRAGAAGHPPR